LGRADSLISSIGDNSMYEISITRLPLPRYPLGEATPERHSIAPRRARTEAEAISVCSELVHDGYEVEVTGPNIHWDHQEVLRRLN
jgi:hypothetical protein